MHALLGAVAETGAKLILIGDRGQLQAIGAGPGLDLVARAVNAARVDSIVRQREAWAREAITDFGRGRAAAALNAFADRGLLLEAQGAKAAIATAVDVADRHRSLHRSESILTKSNAAVAAISREVRERRTAVGLIKGKEVCFIASTPAGHSTEIRLARGDKIRFLARNEDLGVINGTVATVTKVTARRSFVALSDSRIRLEVDVAGWLLVFDPMALADGKGRPRIGWAYASTIHGAQGLTVDHAVVISILIATAMMRMSQPVEPVRAQRSSSMQRGSIVGSTMSFPSITNTMISLSPGNNAESGWPNACRVPRQRSRRLM